jgi:purine-cytosine permease-like protein
VPQLAFLQVIVVTAVVALLLIAVSMPVAARVGWRAGRVLLRVALFGLVAVVIGATIWASQTGELARFSSELGSSDALQIGVFFLIVLGTGGNFAARYLADKAREEAEGNG